MVHPKQPPQVGGHLPTGEDAALERIGTLLRTRLGRPPAGETWTGDDAAVVHVGPGGPVLLLTTDAVVAGVHADLELVDEADIGWKALAAAASDIGAMGGTVGHALVSVGVSARSALDAVLEGIVGAAEHLGCPVVGGDLSEASVLFVAVSVTGTLAGPGGPVLRSGARPGDRLFVTGPLGASAAGLRLLRSGAVEGDLGPGERAAVAAHRRPEARLAEGRAARTAGATAMLDLSDGLGLDLHRLARASGVGFVLDEVPVAPAASQEEAIGGGEDYELLIAVEDGAALEAAFREAGLRPPIAIGECTGDPAQRLLGADPLPEAGYQHRL